MKPFNDNQLVELVTNTEEFLGKIGSPIALRRELAWYEPASLRILYPELEDLACRLFDSLRNTARKVTIITDDKIHALKQVVWLYGIHQLAQANAENVNLINMRALGLSPQDRHGQTLIEFLGGIRGGAEFLVQFQSSSDFYHLIDNRSTTCESAWDLVKESGEFDKIPGMGPVLACDFLGEIGAGKHGKLDLHIVDLFKRLGIPATSRDDIKETFFCLWHIGKITDRLPVLIEKLLWIAMSGRWDRTLGRIPESKNKYLTEVVRPLTRK
jgi:hypothetical protein